MMKHTKLFAACALVLCSVAISCTKDFKEINTDPNRIDQISPGTLLNPLIYDVATFNMDRADVVTFELMQVKITFPDPSGGVHRYEITEGTGSSTWSNYYRAAKNVKEMYEASVKAQDPNYQAIALTLNAWIYSNLTDVFGDVPFTEASKGDQSVLYPKF